jgi:hypothetical protein
MINRKPHGRRSAAVPAHDVQEAPSDPSPQGDVHDQDLACVGPVARSRRKTVKTVPPKQIEISLGMRCILVFDRLIGSLERRELSRVQELQSQLLEDWGLVVELSAGWESKWPMSLPEPEPVPAVEGKELDTMPVVPSSELS